MPEEKCDWLADCLDREDLIRSLQEFDGPKAIVEIGVYTGDFSEQILSVCDNAIVYSVDPWQHQASYKDGCNHSQEKFNKIYHDCLSRLKPFGVRSVVLRKFSSHAAGDFIDGTLDLVYIDGNHCYESCSSDIRIWWPKVKSGGILSGHDYKVDDPKILGVVPAVQEFVHANNLRLFELNRKADCSWAIRKNK